MANRSYYRGKLQSRLLGLDEEGYGDFEYEDAQLNDYIELAVLDLFPDLYKTYRLGIGTAADPNDLNEPPLVPYGSEQALGYVDFAQASRVYRIDDAATLDPITGWSTDTGRIYNIDLRRYPGVIIYYFAPYTPTTNDVDDYGIGQEWTPVIVLGALIEALESKHDTGIIGQDVIGRRYAGVHEEVPLVQQMVQRYTAMRNRLSMSLPVVYV